MWSLAQFLGGGFVVFFGFLFFILFLPSTSTEVVERYLHFTSGQKVCQRQERDKHAQIYSPWISLFSALKYSQGYAGLDQTISPSSNVNKELSPSTNFKNRFVWHVLFQKTAKPRTLSLVFFHAICLTGILYVKKRKKFPVIQSIYLGVCSDIILFFLGFMFMLASC